MSLAGGGAGRGKGGSRGEGRHLALLSLPLAEPKGIALGRRISRRRTDRRRHPQATAIFMPPCVLIYVMPSCCHCFHADIRERERRLVGTVGCCGPAHQLSPKAEEEALMSVFLGSWYIRRVTRISIPVRLLKKKKKTHGNFWAFHGLFCGSSYGFTLPLLPHPEDRPGKPD